MKFVLLASTVVAAIFAPGTVSGQMIPTNDRVRVEVRITGDSARKDLKNTTASAVTQNKTLVILLSGKPKSPESRIVKWTAYGRDMKGHDVRQIESGEVKLDLPANGQQTVESKRISVTYTPDHSEVTKTKSRGNNKGTTKAKKIEASGVKFAGYSVQVLDGSAVVGQASDPENIGKPKPK